MYSAFDQLIFHLQNDYMGVISHNMIVVDYDHEIANRRHMCGCVLDSIWREYKRMTSIGPKCQCVKGIQCLPNSNLLRLLALMNISLASEKQYFDILKTGWHIFCWIISDHLRSSIACKRNHVYAQPSHTLLIGCMQSVLCILFQYFVCYFSIQYSSVRACIITVRYLDRQQNTSIFLWPISISGMSIDHHRGTNELSCVSANKGFGQKSAIRNTLFDSFGAVADPIRSQIVQLQCILCVETSFPFALISISFSKKIPVFLKHY